VVVHGVAAPELADNGDGFLEHLQSNVRRGPAVTEDLLVERLAAPDAEAETALEQELEVAVAWPSTAGWMRIVGQVTPVVT
jgi:hypothetical protein